MADQIDFSIIIPTHNRPHQLAICLEAIAGLKYPSSGFEVIVVDDGSEQSVEPVVARFRSRIHVVLKSQPCGGPASARNAGTSVARGRFLAFTDDDCAPAPDWLERLAARMNKASNHVVGGQTLNALPGNAFATASQLLISYLYSYYNGDPNSARFLASCNLAVPAEGLRSLGGFDATYPEAAAEDRDLCERFYLSGYRMIYAPEAVVYHKHSLKLPSFWRQHFGYGRGAFRFRQVRSRRSTESIRMEPPRFYTGLALYAFRQSQIRLPFFVSVLLIVSQLANAVGFFSEWARQRVWGRLSRVSQG